MLQRAIQSFIATPHMSSFGEIQPVASRHAAAERCVVFSRVSSLPGWIWGNKAVHLLSPESSLTDEPTSLSSGWVIKVELKSYARMLHRMEIISFINLCSTQICVCLHHFLVSESLSNLNVQNIRREFINCINCIIFLTYLESWMELGTDSVNGETGKSC